MPTGCNSASFEFKHHGLPAVTGTPDEAWMLSGSVG